MGRKYLYEFNFPDTQKTINNLQNVLNQKADWPHNHNITEVNNLQTQLNLKANVNHQHNISDINNLQNELNQKAESFLDLNDTINNYVNKAGFFLRVNPTEDGIDAVSLSYASQNHTHNIQDINNLQNELDNLQNQINNLVPPPVGTLILFNTNIAPTSYIPLEGQELDKNIFFELWQYVQNHPELLSSNSNDIAKFFNKNSNTFRLPDYRGSFLRISFINSRFSQYNGGSLNSYELDKLKSHYHNYDDYYQETYAIWNLYPIAGFWGNLVGGLYEVGYTTRRQTLYSGDNETAPFRVSLRIAIKYQ
jgi:hypothetical protein